SGNTIRGLEVPNSTSSANVTGLLVYGSGANTVYDGNTISSLLVGGSSGSPYGIHIYSYAGPTLSGTYRNNMVSLGVDKDGTSISSVTSYGIYDQNGTSTHYLSHSSAYVGGSSLGSGTSSAC